MVNKDFHFQKKFVGVSCCKCHSNTHMLISIA